MVKYRTVPMRRLIDCICLLAFFGAIFRASGMAQTTSLPASRIELVQPENDATLNRTRVRFEWRRTGSLSNGLAEMRIRIFAHAKSFAVTKTVIPEDTARRIAFIWLNLRKDVPRHGRYFWTVEAVDSSGRRTASEIRSFVIEPHQIGEKMPFVNQGFAIRLSYNHRMHTSEYIRLTDEVDPRTHLLSYTDVGFSFRQNHFWDTRFSLEETVKLFSLAGTGAEAMLQYTLGANRYVSYLPYAGAAVGWFATGLNSYSSNAYRGSIGFELTVLPRGYLSLFSEWLFLYRIHYMHRLEGLRTFDGTGWETGLRWILSRSLLTKVHLFGLEIDWEKIQFEFRFGRVRDSYTGVHLDNRRMGVGFLLP